jgi:mannosyltransferase OCH1-like enzyme
MPTRLRFKVPYTMLHFVLLIITFQVLTKFTYDSVQRRECEKSLDYPFPMVIHQMYSSTDLPHEMEMWRKECMMLNKDWEFKLWTDDSILNFIEVSYPHLLGTYLGYDKKIKRIDAARYMILHSYGGVYYDLDMTCLRPFTPRMFSKTNTFYVSRHFEDDDIDSAHLDIKPVLIKGRCANAFMAAPERHPFLGTLLEALPSTRKLENVLDATGPIFLTQNIDRAQGRGIFEFSKHKIYAVTYLQRDQIDECKKNLEMCRNRYQSIMFSFWSHSWW